MRCLPLLRSAGMIVGLVCSVLTSGAAYERCPAAPVRPAAAPQPVYAALPDIPVEPYTVSTGTSRPETAVQVPARMQQPYEEMELRLLCRRYLFSQDSGKYPRRFYRCLSGGGGILRGDGSEEAAEREIRRLLREWEAGHRRLPAELRAALPAEAGQRLAQAYELEYASARRELNRELAELYRRERALYFSVGAGADSRTTAAGAAGAADEAASAELPEILTPSDSAEGRAEHLLKEMRKGGTAGADFLLTSMTKTTLRRDPELPSSAGDSWRHEYRRQLRRGLQEWNRAEAGLVRERMAWEERAQHALQSARQGWSASFASLEAERQSWLAEYRRLHSAARQRWRKRAEEQMQRASRAAEERAADLQREAEALYERARVLEEAAEGERRIMSTALSAWRYWMDMLDDGLENGSCPAVSEDTAAKSMEAALEETYADLSAAARQERRRGYRQATEWAGTFSAAAQRRLQAAEEYEGLCSAVEGELYGAGAGDTGAALPSELGKELDRARFMLKALEVEAGSAEEETALIDGQRSRASEAVSMLESLAASLKGRRTGLQTGRYRELLHEYESAYRRSLGLTALHQLRQKEERLAEQEFHRRYAEFEQAAAELVEPVWTAEQAGSGSAFGLSGLDSGRGDISSFQQAWQVDSLQQYFSRDEEGTCAFLRDLCSWSGAWLERGRGEREQQLREWTQAALYERWQGGDYSSFTAFLKEEVLSAAYLRNRSGEFAAGAYGKELRSALKQAHEQCAGSSGYLMYRFLEDIGLTLPHADSISRWSAREHYLKTARRDLLQKKRRNARFVALNYGIAYASMLNPALWPLVAGHMTAAYYFESLRDTDIEELEEIAQHRVNEELAAFLEQWNLRNRDLYDAGLQAERSRTELALLSGSGAGQQGSPSADGTIAALQCAAGRRSSFHLPAVLKAAGFSELQQLSGYLNKWSSSSSYGESTSADTPLRLAAQGELEKAEENVALLLRTRSPGSGEALEAAARWDLYRRRYGAYLQGTVSLSSLQKAGERALQHDTPDRSAALKDLFHMRRGILREFAAAGIPGAVWLQQARMTNCRRYLQGEDGAGLIALYLQRNLDEEAVRQEQVALQVCLAGERQRRHMEEALRKAVRAWRGQEQYLQRRYVRWHREAAEEIESCRTAWDDRIGRLHTRREEWVRRADRRAAREETGRVRSEAGAAAARAVREVYSYPMALHLARAVDEGRDAPPSHREGHLRELLERVREAGQMRSEYLRERSYPADMSRQWKREYSSSYLSVQRERTGLLQERLAVIRRTRAVEKVRRCEEALLQQIASANTEFEEKLHGTLRDTGYRRRGNLYEKRLLVGMNLFGGGERRRVTIEAYRHYAGYERSPALLRAVSADQRASRPGSADDFICEALADLEAEGLRIFGGQQGDSGEPGHSAGDSSAGSKLHYQGDFGRHIGYAPQMQEHPDPSLGREENIRTPGTGELGRIMGDLAYYSILEGRGWQEADAAFYDRDLWDDRGSTLFGLPLESLSLRSAADLVSGVAAAVGTGGGSLLGSVALSCADDALFTGADIAVQGADAGRALSELAGKVLSSGAGRLIGAGSVLIDEGIRSSGLLELASDLGIVTAETALRGYTSSAISAVDLSALGTGHWFDTRVFSSGLENLSAEVLAGAVGTGVTGTLNTGLRGFTGELYRNGAALNGTLGGLSRAGTEYALTGSASFNLLNWSDISGGGERHGLLELRIGGGERASLAFGAGGVDLSAGILAASAAGFETYRENLRILGSADSALTAHAPALRALCSAGKSGMPAQEKLYHELLAGETLLRKDPRLAAAAVTTMIGGQRVITLGGQGIGGGARDLSEGIILAHEAYRSGMREERTKQFRETAAAVLGHSLVAGQLAEVYGKDILSERLRYEMQLAEDAIRAGDSSLLTSYAARSYSQDGDYWKLVMEHGGGHRLEYDGSRMLTVEYRDEHDRLLSSMVPAGQQTAGLGWAASLGRVIGLSRAAELLGGDIENLAHYDDKTLMDVLGLDAQAVRLLRKRPGVSLERFDLCDRQRYSLVGEALLKDAGAYWDPEAGIWQNTAGLRLTLTDRLLRGNILAQTDQSGGFSYSTVAAEVYRNPLSYLGYREGEENRKYFGLDRIAFTQRSLAGDPLDITALEGLNTVDVTDGGKNTGGVGKDQPWQGGILGTIQGETLQSGSFRMTLDHTGGQWEVEKALRMSGGRTISGKKIDPYGYAGSNGDRHWFHPTNWGRVDGCFTNFDKSDKKDISHREYMNMLRELEEWGVDYGYQIRGTIHDPMEWMYRD